MSLYFTISADFKGTDKFTADKDELSSALCFADETENEASCTIVDFSSSGHEKGIEVHGWLNDKSSDLPQLGALDGTKTLAESFETAMTGDWNDYIKQQLLFTSVTKAISASGVTANDDIQVFEIVPQDSTFGEQKMQATYVNKEKSGFEDSYMKALK